MKKQKEKQLNQVQNQAQEGRSMVEMLGVLAIIGVLSIGGIAGYRWGMDKHITNQILYEMNLNSAQLAMLLQRGNADGVTLSLGSPYDEGNFRTLDYGFEYGCGEYATCGHACQNPDETGYFITATGLPKRVCNMLGDAVFNMAYYYDSEINENDECKDTENTVTVFFDTDTTSNSETSQQPGNSDNPYTPTPEVTAATSATTDISPSTYSSTEATTYTSSATYSPTTLAPTTATTLAPTTAPTLAPTTAPTTLAPTTARTTLAPIRTTASICGGHGSLCGSYCVCDDVGWGGPDCSESSYCHNRGYWTNDNNGYCYRCEGGYGGPDCETPNMCNGKGTWSNRIDGTGYCSCTGAYGGTKCEIPNACNGHGYYWYGAESRCSCKSGWYGTYCDKCNGHGTYYDTSTGICRCYSAYSGNDCENG